MPDDFLLCSLAHHRQPAAHRVRQVESKDQLVNDAAHWRIGSNTCGVRSFDDLEVALVAWPPARPGLRETIRHAHTYERRLPSPTGAHRAPPARWSRLQLLRA